MVLVVGVLVALFAPIAWERLPDFRLVSFTPPSDGPPSEPGPGIQPRPPDPGGGAPPSSTPGGGQPPAIPGDRRVISPTPGSAPGGSAPGGSGPFKYFDTFGDRPPFVSTCSPVPFVIRSAAAPANGDQLVFDALQRVADATGLSFEFQGFTDRLYQFNQRRTRFSWEDQREPLWIGWASDAEVPDLGPKKLDGYAVGVGGPWVFNRSDGQGEILGGGVVLRAGESLPARLGAGKTSGNVLLHELGHALGLAHIDDPAQRMYPDLLDQSPDGYAGGDRQGLAGLSRACP